MINEKSDHFVSAGSFLLSKDGFIVHGCLQMMNHSNIPSKTVHAMKGAFPETGIVSVAIRKSLVHSGSESFCGCQYLDEVTFPQGTKLEWIGKRPALLNVACSRIFLLRLRSFSEMPLHARIQTIRVPKSVREIQSRCFFRCSRLSRIDFEAESCLARFFSEAFRDSGRVDVTFPNLCLS